MANQDINKIKKIKLPNEQEYVIDATYWNGYETLDVKTINGVPILEKGGGDITITLPSALKYCGVTTTKLEDGSTVNPVTINGNDHLATAGCVVFYEDKEFVFNANSEWELFGAEDTYKVVQSPVSSPDVSGDATAFIDTISQDANGVITATKKNVKIPTPNWIAQEGESGYIKNKPTNIIYHPNVIDNDSITFTFSQHSPSCDALDYAKFMSLEIGNTLIDFVYDNNKTVRVSLSGEELNVYYNGYDTVTISDFRNNSPQYYLPQISCYTVCKPIHASLIPNTVLKTTPQTLSNDDKKQALANLGIQDKIDKLVNITYLELKSLRDNSQLIPGQQYRITDYVTTTTQSNTRIAEEYHQFDIIVVADDVNVLNENARAIQHEEDTYFLNSDLNAWELKYCLDNDTNRYAWADDSSNGKGVIYYMKDEFNNECPYDFKNIQFARWELSNPVGYRNDFDEDNWEDNWILESTPFVSLKPGFYGLNGSEDVFYYINNGDYDRYKVEYTISDEPTYCYTFGNGTDYSISGSDYGNVIKEYKKNNKIQLNNIVFLGNSCSTNSFGNNCYDSSFGNSCSTNSFGNNCYGNSFGNSCYGNSFGYGCYFNSFGYDCYSNTFGTDCSTNTFGTDCYTNSFGIGCNYNSFGNSCYFNSFGNTCYGNTFGTDCGSNSFGNYCYSNSFGNTCYGNSFGYGCTNNTFGNSCHYNSFGNNCYGNSFGNFCYDISFGNECTNNTFGESKDNPKSYYRYIIFDNGNRYINLNCTSTTSSSKYYQNVRIGLGVNNTYTDKTINDSNVGQTYETYYKPANSQTITI